MYDFLKVTDCNNKINLIPLSDIQLIQESSSEDYLTTIVLKSKNFEWGGYLEIWCLESIETINQQLRVIAKS